MIIKVHDKMLGDVEIAFSWAYSTGRLDNTAPCVQVKLDGGRCRLGPLVSSGRGLSWPAFLYRYAIDTLGLPKFMVNTVTGQREDFSAAALIEVAQRHIEAVARAECASQRGFELPAAN